MAEQRWNLKQVAARLGVHYATAYRYVRTHQLPAERQGSVWLVRDSALQEFVADRRDPGMAGPATAEGRRRQLADALCRGDEVVAWRVLERALAAGWSPEQCYLDLLAAAVSDLGPEGEESGSHLAAAVAMRLVARLGSRTRRPGRRRGDVVVAAPGVEQHGLAAAILADLLRLAGYGVLELGTGVPATAVADAVRRAERPVAVCLSTSGAEPLGSVREVVGLLGQLDPPVPVVVGGQGVLNDDVARLFGADAWAADMRGAVDAVNALAAHQPNLCGSGATGDGYVQVRGAWAGSGTGPDTGDGPTGRWTSR